jgi:hypothetical protein
MDLDRLILEKAVVSRCSKLRAGAPLCRSCTISEAARARHRTRSATWPSGPRRRSSRLSDGDRLSDNGLRAVVVFAAKYLHGTRFTVEYVNETPLTSAGKREVVVVEGQPTAPAC